MPRWLRVVVVVLLLPAQLSLDGCAPASQGPLRSAADVRAKRKSSYLDAHLRDGGFIAFTKWTYERNLNAVTGTGTRLDADRHTVARGVMTIPIDSVAVFEAGTVDGMPPAMKALTVIVLVALGVVVIGLLVFAIACASDPKCFGSCPTFYVTDGDHPMLQAEGFSASVAPSLEATDIDALYRARPSSRSLDVTMTNEALETHVVRSVRVLAVPRAEGGRVFATPADGFWQASDLRAPVRAAGREGDCRAAVERFDGTERVSLADSTDLAARETLDLEFDAGPGRHGLVIGSRQTLLTTYLFYETLASMGRSTGRWIAALERGDASVRRRVGALGAELGGIEVLAPDSSGGWSRVAGFEETGPIATDVRMIPLPPGPCGRVTLRLRMARGSHRLDWLALARMDRPVEPVRLEPVRVERDTIEDADALASLLDPRRVLTTGPGDRYVLHYTLPDDPQRLELFLESRGYYLEWMRKRWLESENPARLARMMLSPRQAMRDLAPAYAREQVALEDWFWRSRYARP